MHRVPWIGWAVISLAGLPAGAHAASVYLNGVNIDGVTSQKFERATVRIDDKGNVLIEAAGYAVKAVDGAGAGSRTPTPTPVVAPTPVTPPADTGPGQLTRRYWLVTEQTVPGMTEYDIDLYINSKWIRKLRNNEDQIVTEITKYLNAGKNTVLLTAHKVSLGARKSFSTDHVFQVILGEGNVGGDNVMIDNPLVKFKVTAANSEDESKEFTFTTK